MPELAKNSASSRPPYSFKPSVRESPIKREVLRSTGTEVSAGGKVSAGGASVEDSVTGQTRQWAAPQGRTLERGTLL